MTSEKFYLNPNSELGKFIRNFKSGYISKKTRDYYVEYIPNGIDDIKDKGKKSKMTVQDLIDALVDLDQELEVYICDEVGGNSSPLVKVEIGVDFCKLDSVDKTVVMFKYKGEKNES